MSLQNKARFKPIFKQYLRLRENVQNRQKLLKFNKKKWKSFLKFYENKLKNFRKFKASDHSKYFVTKYGTRGTSYNKRFRDTLQAGKRFRLFYGNLLKKYLKKKIEKTLNQKKSNLKNLVRLEIALLQVFESRLDTIIYRAKFAPTIRSAQQLILHGKVYVNKTQIKSKSYLLKSGDIVNLDLKSINLYEQYIINTIKWSLPPKHLIINYKTLQIIFLGNIRLTNMANEFSFNLKLQKILVNYFKQ